MQTHTHSQTNVCDLWCRLTALGTLVVQIETNEDNSSLSHSQMEPGNNNRESLCVYVCVCQCMPVFECMQVHMLNGFCSVHVCVCFVCVFLYAYVHYYLI